jgi:hypothetical protein
LPAGRLVDYVSEASSARFSMATGVRRWLVTK